MAAMDTCAERLVTKYGGRKELADAWGMNRETVRLWLRDGIPLEKALFVEQKSQGFITAEDVVREARAAAMAAGLEKAS